MLQSMVNHFEALIKNVPYFFTRNLPKDGWNLNPQFFAGTLWRVYFLKDI